MISTGLRCASTWSTPLCESSSRTKSATSFQIALWEIVSTSLPSSRDIAVGVEPVAVRKPPGERMPVGVYGKIAPRWVAPDPTVHPEAGQLRLPIGALRIAQYFVILRNLKV
jgi:hypothetical protein